MKKKIFKNLLRSLFYIYTFIIWGWSPSFASPNIKNTKFFKTRLGKFVVPDEKPLASWRVYTEKIIFPKENKELSYKMKNLPETIALRFYQNLVNGKKYQHLLIEKPHKTFSLAINNYLNSREKYSFKEIHFLAKISEKVLRKLPSNSRNMINAKNIDRIQSIIGKFDLLIFIETPPLPHDTFIFLRNTAKGWRIVSSIGWLYSPTIKK